MSRLDSTARLWNHGRAGDISEDTMSDEEATILHLNVNWHWIIAFAQSIAPAINIKTGELGRVGKEEARVFVAIPAHGSPYQNNQCTLRAFDRQRGPGYTISNGSLSGGLILINQNETDTDILIPTDTINNPFWQALVTEIANFVSRHYDIQRAAVGSQFNSILDHYYESKVLGKKVKLAALARQYNVNYNSLRQAKIRYDRRMREPELTDPASGEPEVAGLHFD